MDDGHLARVAFIAAGMGVAIAVVGFGIL